MNNPSQTTETAIPKKQDIIEEILTDLAVYQEPNLLLEKHKERITSIEVDKSKLRRYWDLISNVRYAWQKTLKYELYFTEFYSFSDKIEKIEALNHHIHAYLQDMTILKNKIEVLFGSLKNDVKRVATNKEKVVAFFEVGIQTTKDVFKGVSKYRDPHVHEGMRFLDGDLLKAENAQEFLKLLSNPIFDAMLNQQYKPKIVAKAAKEKEESFEMAKKRWIEMAQGNGEQTLGYLNTILMTVRPSLYQFLGIKPIKDILNLDKN